MFRNTSCWTHAQSTEIRNESVVLKCSVGGEKYGNYFAYRPGTLVTYRAYKSTGVIRKQVSGRPFCMDGRCPLIALFFIWSLSFDLCPGETRFCS